MRSPGYFVRSFFTMVRREGPAAAVRRALRKIVTRVNRPALAQAAWAQTRIDQQATEVEAQRTALDAGLRSLAAAEQQFAADAQRLALAEERLAALSAALEARVAALEHQDREVTRNAIASHARGIMALADLIGMAPPLPGDSPAETPQITVVLPTRDRAALMERAIRSVQHQTWPYWELVVVDDGSQDGTAAALEALAQSDRRIRVIRTDAVGVAKARNAALAIARGEVITYLDDDNEYFPGYLAAVAAAFRGDADLELTYAAQLWVGSGPDVIATFDRYSWAGLFAHSVSMDTNAVAHRIGLFHRLGGFDETLMRHSDLDLAIRYSAESPPQRLPVVAVRYTRDAPRRVTDVMSSAAAMHRIREKYAEPIGKGLRVLVVAWDYPQLSESYIHTEIRWMLSRGVEVEVVARRHPASPGVPLVPVSYGSITEAAKRFDPDVIYSNWLSLTREVGSELSRLDLPVTIRGHGFDHSPELASEMAAEPWVHRLYLFGNLPPPGSDAGKVWVVDASFDSSRYYPVAAKDRRLVLRAGACLPTKDLGLFLEVASRRPEYRFVLALSRNSSGVEVEQELIAQNEALGRPVEILFDVQYEPMAELTRRAAVYLHTFGFHQLFGQPISIAESMATGAVPLIRRAPASMDYGGDAARYYDDADEASAILEEMLSWDEDRWQLAGQAAVESAYRRHADTKVLTPVLQDLLEVVAQSGDRA